MTLIRAPNIKICKYDKCLKEFAAKRLNQEYCCLDCKKKANNGLAARERLIIKRIDDVLKRNRKILDDLYRKDIIVIEFEVLISKGFKPAVHTGRQKDENGMYTLPEFYNYMLKRINDKQFKIEKLW